MKTGSSGISGLCPEAQLLPPSLFRPAENSGGNEEGKTHERISLGSWDDTTRFQKSLKYHSRTLTQAAGLTLVSLFFFLFLGKKLAEGAALASLFTLPDFFQP